MIEIHKDGKNGCYVITQAKNIEGIDFHSQLSLTEEEMFQLAECLTDSEGRIDYSRYNTISR